MILAVDVGNSNTTVGLFNGTGELLFRALLETSRSKTRDQCAIELLGVFQLYGADACTVDGAILSSVVPPLTTIFTDAIARLTGIPPMVVGPGIRTGLNIKAEIHNQLGSDIVASSVAAIAKFAAQGKRQISKPHCHGGHGYGHLFVPHCRQRIRGLHHYAGAGPGPGRSVGAGGRSSAYLH